MIDALNVTSAVAVLATVALFILTTRYLSIRSAFEKRVRDEFVRWRDQELEHVKGQLQAMARKEWEVAFEQWKANHSNELRKDAVQRSEAVTRGKVFEQLVPYLPDFRYNPSDARFLGSPVDFVVFDGLSEREVDRVVFVEVKTGGATLSTRERRVRDAVRAGRVEWKEIRLGPIASSRPAMAAGPSHRFMRAVKSVLARWREKPRN